MSLKKKRILFAFLALIWMGIIFYFSGRVGETSSGMSDTVLRFFEQLFQVDIFNQHSDIIEVAQLLIRKGAHAFVYFVLALLIWGWISTYNPHAYVPTVALCFLYACSDEIHQHFVQGRAGLFSDVLLDTIAAGIAILCLFMFQKYYKRHRI